MQAFSFVASFHECDTLSSRDECCVETRKPFQSFFVKWQFTAQGRRVDITSNCGTQAAVRDFDLPVPVRLLVYSRYAGVAQPPPFSTGVVAAALVESAVHFVSHCLRMDGPQSLHRLKSSDSPYFPEFEWSSKVPGDV